jgi:hypothetical protein
MHFLLEEGPQWIEYESEENDSLRCETCIMCATTEQVNRSCGGAVRRYRPEPHIAALCPYRLYGAFKAQQLGAAETRRSLEAALLGNSKLRV